MIDHGLDHRSVTNQRLDRLSHYLHDLRAKMGLREWDLKLKLDERPSEEGAIAQILPMKNRNIAVVRFAEDFFTMTPVEQRQTCVHEYVHLLTNGIIDVTLSETLRAVMGTVVHDVFYANVNVAEERAVDRIADILAAFMPLPDLDGQEESNGDADSKAPDAALLEGEGRTDETGREERPEDRRVREETAGSEPIERPVQEGGCRADARAEEERPSAEGEGHDHGSGTEDSARVAVSEDGEVSV